MRFLAVLLAALMVAASQPAWAWLETQPGEAEWPEIPGRMGMKAFLGTWGPECNNGAFQENGDMTVQDGDRISYKSKRPYLPTRYRVIEETPHYVVTLVRHPASSDGGVYLDFWAFRPLRKSFVPHGWTEMSVIGINECQVYGDDARKEAIWNFSDAELVEFWKTNKFCHPAMTEKIEGGSYWGGDWGQACHYGKISDTEVAARDIRAADGRINLAYRHLMGTLDEPAKLRLRDQQRAWLNARDAACHLDSKETDRGRWLAGIVENRQTADCVLQHYQERIAVLDQALRSAINVPTGPWPQESPVKTFNWQAVTGYWRTQDTPARYLYLSSDGFIEADKPDGPVSSGRVRPIREVWTTGEGENLQELAVLAEYRLCPGEAKHSEFRVLALANDVDLRRYLTFDAVLDDGKPPAFDAHVDYLWQAFKKQASGSNFRSEWMWRAVPESEIPSWFRNMTAETDNGPCR